ncbi:cell division protein FtsQ/DivIB [Tissierella creatinophila]|uniref:Cell division protein FtsQ n=1 Tax=Tissierella creatinophila DSM 6911 TaxID=1123403 RepID=A0A1U7M9C4_TISCR|nr:FtsQ-type POTRA domain-containing protein [Tissierella creatinophila]OLS03885.1 cell division protein FtsQ [Tissierella creatinophila DSM 6911]
MRKKTPIERLHKARKVFLGIIIFLGLLSIFIFFALNSPFFHIKEINIRNNKSLNKEEILKQSKVRTNTNIFKFKISDIEDNLKTNTFIKSAKVKRELPNTLNINVMEREKTILFQYISMYLVVDEDGFIMEHLDSKDEKLPIVTGFNTNFTDVSENIFSQEQNRNLKIFIKEGKNLHLLENIDEIEKDFSNDVNIKLKNGIFVAFGTLNNVKYKLGLLKEILEDVEKREIKASKIIMNKGNHPILIKDD